MLFRIKIIALLIGIVFLLQISALAEENLWTRLEKREDEFINMQSQVNDIEYFTGLMLKMMKDIYIEVVPDGEKKFHELVMEEEDKL